VERIVHASCALIKQAATGARRFFIILIWLSFQRNSNIVSNMAGSAIVLVLHAMHLQHVVHMIINTLGYHEQA
jgi:hypothetical protein